MSRHRTASTAVAGKTARATADADDMPLLPSSTTTFQFVTFSEPDGMRDGRAISQIRRHAMKEIGKSRRIPKPTKPKRARRREAALSEPASISPQPPRLSGQRIGCGGIDPFCQFPVALDETSTVLVEYLFSDRLKAYRDEWLPITFVDASSFHSLLACMALHLASSSLPDRPFRENATALYHHQLAVRAAQEQLRRADGDITDGLVGTALCLYQFTEFLDDPREWGSQRNGLLALVHKSGLDRLSRNRRLRHAMSWIDLRSAYTRDIVPAFPIPDSWLEAAENVFGVDDHHDTSASRERGDEFSHRIFRIYCRLRMATSEVRQHTKGSLAPTTDIPVLVMIVLHELLSSQLPISVLKQAVPTVLALEAWRIGMLLFLAPIYRFYGAHPVFMDNLVAKAHRLRKVWSMWDHWDPHSRTLLTWTLFMVAFEAQESDAEDIRRWCADVSARIANEFVGPSDGQGLLIMAKSVVWVPELLDAKAEGFVREIDERRLVGPKDEVVE